MTLQEIINEMRRRLGDDRGPVAKRLWSDTDLVTYANDAEREVARKLELLRDSDTIGYVVLSGTVGQVDSISVSGVTITSGAVVFATTLTALATNLAANINAYTSTPNYRAVSRGTLVIIKASTQTGYPSAGYTLAAAASAGITAACTDLPGLTRYVVAVGQRYLTLNDKIVRIVRFKPSLQAKPIRDYTKDDLDAEFPGWEEYENGTISRFAPDYDSNEAIVVPAPSAVELIEQEVYRLPLVDFTVNDLGAIPEISARHHETMIEWGMRQAYKKNDVETLDINRSMSHETEFNRRIEEWKREHIKRGSQGNTNQMPSGVF